MKDFGASLKELANDLSSGGARKAAGMGGVRGTLPLPIISFILYYTAWKRKTL